VAQPRAEPYTCSHGNTGTFPLANHTARDSIADSHGLTNRHTDPDPDANLGSHADALADGNAERDADSESHTYTHTSPNAITDRDAVHHDLGNGHEHQLIGWLAWDYYALGWQYGDDL